MAIFHLNLQDVHMPLKDIMEVVVACEVNSLLGCKDKVNKLSPCSNDILDVMYSSL
jgi:hypothetical protein